jgi:hypothetical protein
MVDKEITLPQALVAAMIPVLAVVSLAFLMATAQAKGIILVHPLLAPCSAVLCAFSIYFIQLHPPSSLKYIYDVSKS